jgi:hypothetical protein
MRAASPVLRGSRRTSRIASICEQGRDHDDRKDDQECDFESEEDFVQQRHSASFGCHGL